MVYRSPCRAHHIRETPIPDTTISAYLIHRLKDLGARHVFGLPCNHVLGLYKALEYSNLDVINTCDEQGIAVVAVV